MCLIDFGIYAHVLPCPLVLIISLWVYGCFGSACRCSPSFFVSASTTVVSNVSNFCCSSTMLPDPVSGSVCHFRRTHSLAHQFAVIRHLRLHTFSSLEEVWCSVPCGQPHCIFPSSSQGCRQVLVVHLRKLDCRVNIAAVVSSTRSGSGSDACAPVADCRHSSSATTVAS